MQFFTAITVLAAAIATVGAAAVETNAQRMARGLPPKSPVRRGSPTLMAARGHPSGSGECKPLLQSCSINSECCADVCLLGVRPPPLIFYPTSNAFPPSPQLCL
ncbi:hypothetical protein FIBSPDRAFT_946656 [Athelia psychrophila]|uniref:Hydrophobin n=1 Tax=Athelia psychrophila TaxID=1759441 RepID=A0A166SSQ2_9AGAM|nr:hypothetical protein FIBSPDRAFT_946656 [Fibularhizoctonia sp. CBS 109695]